jgi:hypothetical protein
VFQNQLVDAVTVGMMQPKEVDALFHRLQRVLVAGSRSCAGGSSPSGEGMPGGGGEAGRRARTGSREVSWTRAQAGPRGPAPWWDPGVTAGNCGSGRESSRGTPRNGAEADGPRRRRRGGRTGATRDGAVTDRTPAQAGRWPADADANGGGEREPQPDLGQEAVVLARRAVGLDGSGRCGALRREGTRRGGQAGGRKCRCRGRKAEREAEPSVGQPTGGKARRSARRPERGARREAAAGGPAGQRASARGPGGRSAVAERLVRDRPGNLRHGSPPPVAGRGGRQTVLEGQS